MESKPDSQVVYKFGNSHTVQDPYTGHNTDKPILQRSWSIHDEAGRTSRCIDFWGERHTRARYVELFWLILIPDQFIYCNFNLALLQAHSSQAKYQRRVYISSTSRPITLSLYTLSERPLQSLWNILRNVNGSYFDITKEDRLPWALQLPRGIKLVSINLISNVTFRF